MTVFDFLDKYGADTVFAVAFLIMVAGWAFRRRNL